jgi:type II secretory pathway pseudopilin PulG
MNQLLQWIGGALAIVIAIVLGRWLWHLGKAVKAERARELFRLQHERFEEQLLQNAAATGLPRGLKWLSCEIRGDAVLVRDTMTGGIVALVPVMIEFEPVEGSDMVDVPAARDPRPGTAVFSFAHGTWETSGRIVFNHTPEQTITAFSPQFRIIHHGQH